MGRSSIGRIDRKGSFGVMGALISITIVTFGALAIIASAQGFQMSLDDDRPPYEWDIDLSTGIDIDEGLEGLGEAGMEAGMTSLVICEMDGGRIVIIESDENPENYRSYPAPIIHSEDDVRPGMVIAGW